MIFYPYKLIKKFEMNFQEVMCIKNLNQRDFKEIFEAMRPEAKKRVKQLFHKGCFATYHDRRRLVRTIGIILSLEKRIMVKVSSPPRDSGIINELSVELCSFNLNQLFVDKKSGKYKHFSGKSV